MTPLHTLPLHLPAYHSLWLSALVVTLDYITGPIIQFPVMFILPVAYAAWYGGATWAIALAIVLPLARIVTVLSWGAPWGLFETLVNASIRMIVLTLVGGLIAVVSNRYRLLAHEVDLLEGMLPICSHCKRVRSDSGDWQGLEDYCAAHSPDTQFSHGICPSCLKQYFRDEPLPRTR